MGKLGGSLMGLFGLEGWDSPRSLSDGTGLESLPDGKPSAANENLLVNDAGDNRLVNDAGDVLLLND